MKKFLCIVLSAILFCFPVSAKTVSMEYDAGDLYEPLPVNNEMLLTENLQINAKSSILMEYNTGKILYEENCDEKLPPASITKIMSLILVFEAIDEGKLSLDTKVTASETAAALGGSQIWLEPGEIMTVDELLRAVVIASANDATVALAEAVAGSEESFVSMMNEKAKQLGMNNTHFINSYGLDAEGHLTTAHDIALMSAELISHDIIRNYSTVAMDSLRGGESELVNTNKLIRYYKGCFGLKTGTTSGAGSCLSATAERDGLTLIAVVLGSPTSKDRFAGAQKLLDFGFANYSFVDYIADTSELKNIPVKGGTVREIVTEVNEKFPLLLKKGQQGNITQKVSITEQLTAPVSRGDTVGYVHVYNGEEELGAIPIVAKNASEKLTYGVCLKRLLISLFTL